MLRGLPSNLLRKILRMLDEKFENPCATGLTIYVFNSFVGLGVLS